MNYKLYKQFLVIGTIIILFGGAIGVGNIQSIDKKNGQIYTAIQTQNTILTEINDELKTREETLATEYWALIFAVGIYKDHPNQDRPSMLEAADDLYDVLLGSPQWQADHIHKVKGAQCTLSRLIQELLWLVNSVKSDDMVVVFLTTHGNRLKDDQGNFVDIPPKDEVDGADEALVMYEGFNNDLEIIWDDLLNYFLSMMKAQGICLIVDSCFSGGFNDNIVDVKNYELDPASNEISDERKISNKFSNPKTMIKDLILKIYQNVVKNDGYYLKNTPSHNREVDIFTQEFINDLMAGSRIILMSCEEDTVSYGSTFTNFLIDGFWGMADLIGNGNGINSAEEAFAYSDWWVNVLSGGDQNPTIRDNYPGEFTVTYN
ncbi:hypothetical protein AYK24_03820 [Thermoplasmatales archaeon SG8-52-4]|nr:MAG: hypothetical protein AYK24_03820 [Thermoplasmatales archaeon SG8-52-4]